MARTSRIKRNQVEGDRFVAVINALVGKDKGDPKKPFPRGSQLKLRNLLKRNPLDAQILDAVFNRTKSRMKPRGKSRGGGGGKGF